MIHNRSLSLLVAMGMLGVPGCVIQDDDAKDTAQGGADTVVAVPIGVPVTDTLTLTDTLTVTDTVTDTVTTVTPVPVPVPVDTTTSGRRGATRRDTTR